MVKGGNISPLTQIIGRLPELNITLPLLKKSIDAVARSRNRYGVGGEEIERGREAEGDERLVEVPGAVLEVPRVRERRRRATATVTHASASASASDGVLVRVRRGLHCQGGGSHRPIVSGCSARICEEARVRVYPEIEARGGGHGRRRWGGEIWRRRIGFDLKN
jgi:hypothetical protein